MRFNGRTDRKRGAAAYLDTLLPLFDRQAPAAWRGGASIRRVVALESSPRRSSPKRTIMNYDSRSFVAIDVDCIRIARL